MCLCFPSYPSCLAQQRDYLACSSMFPCCRVSLPFPTLAQCHSRSRHATRPLPALLCFQVAVLPLLLAIASQAHSAPSVPVSLPGGLFATLRLDYLSNTTCQPAAPRVAGRGQPLKLLEGLTENKLPASFFRRCTLHLICVRLVLVTCAY